MTRSILRKKTALRVELLGVITRSGLCASPPRPPLVVPIDTTKTKPPVNRSLLFSPDSPRRSPTFLKMKKTTTVYKKQSTVKPNAHQQADNNNSMSGSVGPRVTHKTGRRPKRQKQSPDRNKPRGRKWELQTLLKESWYVVNGASSFATVPDSATNSDDESTRSLQPSAAAADSSTNNISANKQVVTRSTNSVDDIKETNKTTLTQPRKTLFRNKTGRCVSKPTVGHARKPPPPNDPARSKSTNSGDNKRSNNKHSVRGKRSFADSFLRLDDGPRKRPRTIANNDARSNDKSSVTTTWDRHAFQPLSHWSLLDQYDELVVKEMVEPVRFGRTLATTMTAIERKVADLKERVVKADDDKAVLADIKEYKRSLRRFSAFEDQEKLNTQSDPTPFDYHHHLTDGSNYNTSKEELELSQRPIVFSSRRRLTTRHNCSVHKNGGGCSFCSSYRDASPANPLTQQPMPGFQPVDWNNDLSSERVPTKQDRGRKSPRRAARAKDNQEKARATLAALRQVGHSLAFVERYNQAPLAGGK